jgi:hypothetical protein
MVRLELQIRHIFELRAHEISVDTAQYSNVAHHQDRPPLSFEFNDDRPHPLYYIKIRLPSYTWEAVLELIAQATLVFLWVAALDFGARQAV